MTEKSSRVKRQPDGDDEPRWAAVNEVQRATPGYPGTPLPERPENSYPYEDPDRAFDTRPSAGEYDGKETADLNNMKDSRELLQPGFTRDWGPRAAEAVKSSPAATGAVQAVARKLVDYAHWVQSKPGEKVLPALPQPVKRAQDAYLERMTRSKTPEQDEELAILQEKNRRIQEAIDKAKAPQDLGDIDAPQGRQPVQMSREFPKTPQGQADEQAYIQRAREAAKKASGK